ncbi:hypothetical protein SDC9_206624 [bioreactor metagenome]|uniref:Uncharacterized protein n=1 Tax=bioreactor metagenome TaxID=1076179 RepID=A0A645J5I2_9ZZZZ
MPTADEVKKSLNQRKKEVSAGRDYQEFIQSYLRNTTVTEEDYWGVYEMCFEYRSLADMNLWQQLSQEWQKNIEHNSSETMTALEFLNKKTVAYKKAAKIKITTSIQELRYQIFPDKVSF